MKNFTRQAIIDSYMKFLSEKQLKDITVKDIVTDCDMNRKTFYYYFSDIYELTEKVFLEYVEKLHEKFPPDRFTWMDAIGELSDFMKKNEKITIHIYKSIGYERLEDVFYRTCQLYFPEHLRNIAFDLNVKDEYIDLLSKYYSSTISGIMARWVKDGMKDFPEKLVSDFKEIMQGTPRVALENASKIHC